MVKLYRCKICGEPIISDQKTDRCPFCGAYPGFIIEAKDYKETFDVELSEKDRANAEKALDVEISNSSFYFCAAEKSEDEETRQLFKALGKVEAEHASIWRKILKQDKETIKASDSCSTKNIDNLNESHEREDAAINFYREAAKDSESPRLKQIFVALVQIETDHLKISEERLA